MEYLLLIKLLAAHLIGDFVLQPQKWIADKVQKKWKSGWLYVHVFIHFVLILLFTWDLSFWLPALIIMISHLAIDLIKLVKQKESNISFWFFTDQLLHLFVITGVWAVITEGLMLPEIPAYLWITVTGFILVTTPSSLVIKNVIMKWSDIVAYDDHESLKGAGEYIGILERSLIYIAILGGHLQVIGFLIAAKSVFRFGDLTRTKDRRLTEYILVGTLLSFLTAILIGIAVNSLLRLS